MKHLVAQILIKSENFEPNFCNFLIQNADNAQLTFPVRSFFFRHWAQLDLGSKQGNEQFKENFLI